MPVKVFFSWQSDTPPNVGQRFIADAIERACEELSEVVIEESERPEMDRDTKGIGSQAEIFKTICRKIDECSVFIADLTYIPTSSAPRKSPNPNVLIEYGWALKSRTIDRIIWVMNTAYGTPKDDPMPFDLIHYRQPIAYKLSEHANKKEIMAETEKLVGILKESIQIILRDTSGTNYVERLRPPDVSGQLLGVASFGQALGHWRSPGQAICIKSQGSIRIALAYA